MAEDLSFEDSDPQFDELVDNLLAMYQASIQVSPRDPSLSEAIRAMMWARRSSVLSRVPDGGTRRRYARSGLAVESSLHMDAALGRIVSPSEDVDHLSLEWFSEVMQTACRAVELADCEPQELARLGYEWIRVGRYDAVYVAAGRFESLDDAVEFVEDVLCYRLPWVVNGLVRLMETAPNEDVELSVAQVPQHLRMLPDFLRYGADREELVWVMSLGFRDRPFAEWLLKNLLTVRGRAPESFREAVTWIVAERKHLMAHVGEGWPGYFGRILERILTRYSRLVPLLEL